MTNCSAVLRMRSASTVGLTTVACAPQPRIHRSISSMLFNRRRSRAPIPGGHVPCGDAPCHRKEKAPRPAEWPPTSDEPGYEHRTGQNLPPGSGDSLRQGWWALRDSNPRPTRCKRDALTTAPSAPSTVGRPDCTMEQRGGGAREKGTKTRRGRRVIEGILIFEI